MSIDCWIGISPINCGSLIVREGTILPLAAERPNSGNIFLLVELGNALNMIRRGNPYREMRKVDYPWARLFVVERKEEKHDVGETILFGRVVGIGEWIKWHIEQQEGA